MLDYKGIEALAFVAREGSFGKAAKALFRTQSAISQRIRILEEELGQPLLTRTAPIRLTDAGHRLIRHYRQVKLLESDLPPGANTAGNIEPVPISIGINTETLATWFIDAVEGVLREGHLLVDFLIDDQERTINMLSTGRVWGCVTSVGQPPYGCISTFLGKMRYRTVATPDFYRRYYSQGVHASTMLRAPHVIYGERDYMAVGFYRKVVRGYSKGTPQIHHVPSPQGIVRFAVDGLASALLPEYSIQPMLQDGRLVDLLPDKPFLLPLYWQTQTLQTGVTAKMSDSIVSHAKRVLLS